MIEAVGIGIVAGAPAAEVGVPLLLLAGHDERPLEARQQHGAEVGLFKGQVEAAVLGLVGEELHELGAVGLAGTQQDVGLETLAVGVDADAVVAHGPAGLVKDLVGLVDVVLVLGNVRVVGPAGGRDVGVDGHALAVRGGLDRGVLVHAVGQRLAHRLLGEEATFAQVELQVEVAEVGVEGELQAGSIAQLRVAISGQRVLPVDVTTGQCRGRGDVVLDDGHVQLLERRGTLVVLLVARSGDVLAGAELGHVEGTGADRHAGGVDELVGRGDLVDGLGVQDGGKFGQAGLKAEQVAGLVEGAGLIHVERLVRERELGGCQQRLGIGAVVLGLDAGGDEGIHGGHVDVGRLLLEAGEGGLDGVLAIDVLAGQVHRGEGGVLVGQGELHGEVVERLHLLQHLHGLGGALGRDGDEAQAAVRVELAVVAVGQLVGEDHVLGHQLLAGGLEVHIIAQLDGPDGAILADLGQLGRDVGDRRQALVEAVEAVVQPLDGLGGGDIIGAVVQRADLAVDGVDERRLILRHDGHGRQRGGCQYERRAEGEACSSPMTHQRGSSPVARRRLDGADRGSALLRLCARAARRYASPRGAARSSLDCIRAHRMGPP